MNEEKSGMAKMPLWIYKCDLAARIAPKIKRWYRPSIINLNPIIRYNNLNNSNAILNNISKIYEQKDKRIAAWTCKFKTITQFTKIHPMNNKFLKCWLKRNFPWCKWNTIKRISTLFDNNTRSNRKNIKLLFKKKKISKS